MEKRYRKIRSFIVRRGRTTKLQRNALENYMGLFGVNYEKKELDFGDLFENDNDVVVEIGFGDGRSTLQVAERNREIDYIAIDVYPPGVGTLLDNIYTKKIDNIKVIDHDAAEVLTDMIPDDSVSGFHIFFPDPWHKKRHNKRRLINSSFISCAACKLRSGGYIYAVTDWEDYAMQMQEVMRKEPLLFSPFAGFAEKGSAKLPWRAPTKFEEKGISEGRTIRESFFIRK